MPHFKYLNLGVVFFFDITHRRRLPLRSLLLAATGTK